MRQQVTKRERSKCSEILRRTDLKADSGGPGRVVKVGGVFLVGGGGEIIRAELMN